MQFNTAIAKMMEFLNDFTRLPKYPRKVLQWAVQALSPFAPHIAEEMWQLLKGVGELSDARYPEIDPKYLVDESIIYVVQVNGKLRGRFELPKDQTQEVIIAAAKQHAGIMKFLDGAEIKKVIFVPNKLLNFVL